MCHAQINGILFYCRANFQKELVRSLEKITSPLARFNWWLCDSWQGAFYPPAPPPNDGHERLDVEMNRIFQMPTMEYFYIDHRLDQCLFSFFDCNAIAVDGDEAPPWQNLKRSRVRAAPILPPRIASGGIDIYQDHFRKGRPGPNLAVVNGVLRRGAAAARHVPRLELFGIEALNLGAEYHWDISILLSQQRSGTWHLSTGGPGTLAPAFVPAKQVLREWCLTLKATRGLQRLSVETEHCSSENDEEPIAFAMEDGGANWVCNGDE